MRRNGVAVSFVSDWEWYSKSGKRISVTPIFLTLKNTTKMKRLTQIIGLTIILASCKKDHCENSCTILRYWNPGARISVYNGICDTAKFVADSSRSDYKITCN